MTADRSRSRRQTGGGSPPPDDDDQRRTPLLPDDAMRVVNLLDEAHASEMEGLGLTVAAGNRFATADRARQQAASAVSAAQGFVGRVVMPQGLLAPTAAAAVATPAPPAEPPQQQNTAPAPAVATTTRNPRIGVSVTDRNVARNFGIALIAGLVTFLVVLFIISVIAEHAAGDNDFATNGVVQFLIALVFGLAAAMIVSSYGPSDPTPEEHVTEVHVHQDRTQLRAAPVAPATQPTPASPDAPAPGS